MSQELGGPGMSVAPHDEAGAPSPSVADQTEVGSLIRLALDRGVDVAVLERLVALKERVTDRDARAAFFAAVASFQDECPEIPKGRTANITTQGGGEYSYKYAPLDVIARIIRPYLRKHGLSYTWTTETSAAANVLDVVCVLRHTDGHEERARFPVVTDTNAKMSAAQKGGAAMTYGRRQTLVAVLGIVTADDDDDGQDGRKGSGETVSGDQIAKLNARMLEVGADLKRFLRYMGATSLDKLRASDFDRAMAALDARAATLSEPKK